MKALIFLPKDGLLMITNLHQTKKIVKKIAGYLDDECAATFDAGSIGKALVQLLI